MIATKRKSRSKDRHAMYFEALEARELMSTVMWTGAGQSPGWSVADNWIDSNSSVHVPYSTDDVLFAPSSSATVTLDSGSLEVASMTIGAGADVTFADGTSGNGYSILSVSGVLTICNEYSFYCPNGEDTQLTVGPLVNLVPMYTVAFGDSDEYFVTFNIEGHLQTSLTSLAVSDAGQTGYDFIAATHTNSLPAGGGSDAVLAAAGVGTLPYLDPYTANNTGSGSGVILNLGTNSITDSGTAIFRTINQANAIHMDLGTALTLGEVSIRGNATDGTYMVDGQKAGLHIQTTRQQFTGYVVVTDWFQNLKGVLAVDQSYVVADLFVTSPLLSWFMDFTNHNFQLGINMRDWGPNCDPIMGLTQEELYEGHTITRDMTLNTADPAWVKMGCVLGKVQNEDETWSCRASALTVNGIVTLQGHVRDFLQVLAVTDEVDFGSGDEFCIMHAGTYFTGEFTDMDGFNGNDIGLQMDTCWRLEIRGTGHDLYLVKYEGT